MNTYNPDSQRLFVNDVINCRELGGMPLKNDRVFINKLFLRSGSPSYATSKGISLIKEYGVRTVIDLRAESELNRLGNPFKVDRDVTFYSKPLLIGDPDDLTKDPTMIYLRDHHLGDFYVIVLEELKSQVADIMRIFLDCEGVVLFHCAHGKDRTGVIAALLYLLAGASRENIIRNYEISYTYARDFLDELMSKREDCLKHTLRSDAINMEIMLDYIDSKYDGDISKYLLSAGLTIDEIGKLKSKLY